MIFCLPAIDEYVVMSSPMGEENPRCARLGRGSYTLAVSSTKILFYSYSHVCLRNINMKRIKISTYYKNDGIDAIHLCKNNQLLFQIDIHFRIFTAFHHPPSRILSNGFKPHLFAMASAIRHSYFRLCLFTHTHTISLWMLSYINVTFDLDDSKRSNELQCKRSTIKANDTPTQAGISSGMAHSAARVGSMAMSCWVYTVHISGRVWLGKIMGSIFIYICEKIYVRSSRHTQGRRRERTTSKANSKKRKENLLLFLPARERTYISIEEEGGSYPMNKVSETPKQDGEQKKLGGFVEGGAQDPQRGRIAESILHLTYIQLKKKKKK